MLPPILRSLYLLPLLAVLQLPAPAVAAPVGPGALNTTELAGDIVYLTNKQRQLHGCDTVHSDVRLTEASTAHSAYMARTGAFSHTNGVGQDFAYRDRVAHYPRPLAENIAYGYRTGVEVVLAWMDSPLHRANLLNCKATTVGVGVVVATDGTPYITQDFGS